MLEKKDSRMTNFVLLVAICFLSCSLLKEAESQEIQNVIGSCSTAQTSPQLNSTFSDTLFTQLRGASMDKDGNWIIVDAEYVRKYDVATGLVTALPLNWKGDSEVFYKLNAGIETCTNCVAYHPIRNEYYLGCTTGIAVVRGKTITKLIAGNGALTTGDFSTLKLTAVKRIIVNSDTDSLIVNSNPSSTTNIIYNLDLTNKTATQIQNVQNQAMTSVLKCSAAGATFHTQSMIDLFALDPSNSAVFTNYCRGPTGTISVTAMTCSTDPDMPYHSSSTTVYKCTGRFTRSAIATGFTNIKDLSVFGNTLFVSDAGGITAVDLTTNAKTVLSVKTTVPSQMKDYYSFNTSAVVSMNLGDPIYIAPVNNTVVAILSAQQFRLIDFATGSSFVYFSGTGAPTTVPGASIFQYTATMPVAFDRNLNIFGFGHCYSSRCYKVFQLAPTADGYEASLLTGSGDSTSSIADGPLESNSLQFFATDGLIATDDFIYQTSNTAGVRMIDRQTRVVTTIIPTASTMVDGPLPVAKVYTAKGAALNGDELLWIDFGCIRALNLVTNITRTLPRPNGLDVDSGASIIAVLNETIFETSTSMSSKLHMLMNETYDAYVGCQSAAEVECNWKDAAYYTAGSMPIHLTVQNGELYQLDKTCIKKFIPVKPSAPEIRISSVTNTSMVVSVITTPKKWGGAAANAIIRWRPALDYLPPKIVQLPSVFSYTLTGLEVSTSYEVCASLQNSLGTSTSSCTIAKTNFE